MQGTLKAVIFDMDGVLINSEHLWRKAMIRGFNEFGMPVSEAECRKTMGTRIGEVIRLWTSHFSSGADPDQVEKRIMDLLLEYIASEGEAIPSIPELLNFCEEHGLRTGLATSSSHRLMNAVLEHLKIRKYFQACVSAEHLTYGKPHPEVFIRCAQELGCLPAECLVIEDSLNGVIAGKAAQMQVIAVPDDEHTRLQQFAVADYKMNNITEVLALFRNNLFGTKHEPARTGNN